MGKTEGNNTVRIHILHSIKGGCGKSTCALFMTLKYANQAEEALEAAKVLLVDADFRGSALQTILFLTNAEERRPVTYAQNEKTDDLLQKYSHSINRGRGLQHRIAIPMNFHSNKTLSHYVKGEVSSAKSVILETFSYDISGTEEQADEQREGGEQTLDINGWFDVILSSQDSRCKDWFSNRSGKISGGIFAYRMEILFRQVLFHRTVRTEESEKREKYTDIVIDMPPGYDEYSDILLNILRKIAEETKHKNVELHYYAVTTDDIGHLQLTQDNIRKLQKEDTNYKPFKSINLILNSITSTDFRNIEKDLEGYKNLVGTTGKVFRNVYLQDYHEYCRSFEKVGFGQKMEEILNIQE